MNGFIPKPFDVEQLYQSIEKFLTKLSTVFWRNKRSVYWGEVAVKQKYLNVFALTGLCLLDLDNRDCGC